ncbi:hypothetical protein UAMX_002124, partial [Candidatus Uabimicrobium amorphum]
EYRLWNFNANSKDPFPTAKQRGKWGSIKTGHVLVPVGNGKYVLDWVPATGEYCLWNFNANSKDPLPTAKQRGKWSSIKTGHVLIPVGNGKYVLDWVPATGEYRLWNFNANFRDPLPTAKQDGSINQSQPSQPTFPIRAKRHKVVGSHMDITTTATVSNTGRLDVINRYSNGNKTDGMIGWVVIELQDYRGNILAKFETTKGLNSAIFSSLSWKTNIKNQSHTYQLSDNVMKLVYQIKIHLDRTSDDRGWRVLHEISKEAADIYIEAQKYDK